jgi:hypothetical protein
MGLDPQTPIITFKKRIAKPGDAFEDTAFFIPRGLKL